MLIGLLSESIVFCERKSESTIRSFFLRIQTKEKANVVIAVWGTEFIKFLPFTLGLF